MSAEPDAQMPRPGVSSMPEKRATRRTALQIAASSTAAHTAAAAAGNQVGEQARGVRIGGVGERAAGTEVSSVDVLWAETFVRTLPSRVVQQWYRARLNSLPCSVLALKAPLLDELVEVLDEETLAGIGEYLRKFMAANKANKGNRANEGNAAYLPSSPRNLDPFLLLLVVPQTHGPRIEALARTAGLVA